MTKSFVAAAVLLAAAFLPSAHADMAQDRDAALALLAGLDDLSQSPEEMLALYAAEPVILAPDTAEIRGRAALLEHLRGFGAGMELTIRHEPVEITSFSELVVVQGRVVGTARPEGSEESYPFETKNIILMTRREDGALAIWKVIYNSAPASTD